MAGHSQLLDCVCSYDQRVTTLVMELVGLARRLLEQNLLVAKVHPLLKN